MRHEWTAIIALPLTEDEVERIRVTGKLVMTNIDETRAKAATTVGCVVCEAALEDGVDLDSECPGEPE